MSKKTFTRGKAVIYTNPKTGSKFRGTVKSTIETLRGLWYEIKDADGNTVKARAASLRLA